MKKILLLSTLSLLLITSACQQPQEVTVTKYFEAMKANDKTTLQTMSADPKDLEFKSYEIMDAPEAVQKELELQALQDELENVKKGMKDLSNKAADVKDQMFELEDELDETRRSSRKRELKKQIEEKENEVKEIEKEFKGYFPVRSKLKKKIDVEKTLIYLSTGKRESLEIYEGHCLHSKVVVKVTLANDTIEDYVFLLRKYVFKIKDKVLPSRFVIVKIERASDYKEEPPVKKEEVEEVTEEPVADQQPAEEGAAQE